MKRSIAIILSSSILLSLASCYKTEENLWEDSSAERVDKKLAEYENILCAEENGWVLQYFANESEQAYPLLMKFDKTSAVKMAANNSVSSSTGYTEAESTYELISDMGPVLTFNTYNPLMHCFSDPGSDGLGHLGDYEFVFYNLNDDGSLTLRGKKSGIKMSMIKFPIGASYIVGGQTKTVESWENYYEAYNAVKSGLFPSSAKCMALSLGGKTYMVSGMNDGVLSFVSAEEEGVAPVSLSYVLGLDNTLHLSSAFNGVSNFKLSDEGWLVSTDAGQDAYFFSGDVAKCFVYEGNIWRLNKSSLYNELSQLYAQLVADCKQFDLGTLQYLQFAWNTSYDRLTLAMEISKIKCNFIFDSNVDSANEVTVAFNEESTRSNGSVETTNAMLLYDKIESVRKILQMLSSKYSMTGNSPLVITSIVMTDAAGNSFTVDSY